MFSWEVCDWYDFSTSEGLVAGVGGRAAGDAPAGGPVAVDVGADAAVAGDGLPVLAPETGVGLRVDEAYGNVSIVFPWNFSGSCDGHTVGVDNREDVEVVLVNVRLDSSIGIVLGDQLVRNILIGLYFRGKMSVTLKFEGFLGTQLTRVVIHSRAWTVECRITPGFEFLPPEPQKWIPVMLRPS